MEVATVCILPCQKHAGQEKSLQDLPGKGDGGSVVLMQWCGPMWSKWGDDKAGMLSWRVGWNYIFYRKTEETSNMYQLLSRTSLQVVSHSALNDVLSKPDSKCTKGWVFHHFPRDGHPWPNWSSCQEGFFYIFSLIFPILNFIPLLLVKPTPIVLNNSPPSGIIPLHVFVGYSFVPL